MYVGTFCSSLPVCSSPCLLCSPRRGLLLPHLPTSCFHAYRGELFKVTIPSYIHGTYVAADWQTDTESSGRSSYLSFLLTYTQLSHLDDLLTTVKHSKGLKSKTYFYCLSFIVEFWREKIKGSKFGGAAKERERQITSLADCIFPKPDYVLLSLMCQDQKLGNISRQIF